MSNSLSSDIVQLKGAIIEMMHLVQIQLEKAREAFLYMDTDLAEAIIHTEKRVNAMEISIDRDCENIFALHSPYATDLRYVISALKINSDLERIGDYAENLSNYVLEIDNKYDQKIIQKVQLVEMFDISISMLNGIGEAFEEENSKLARKVFKQDTLLNKINMNSSSLITSIVEKDPSYTRSALFLFSAIRKLERVGDHVKNIAENIIFFQEAKILKHKKNKSGKG